MPQTLPPAGTASPTRSPPPLSRTPPTSGATCLHSNQATASSTPNASSWATGAVASRQSGLVSFPITKIFKVKIEQEQTANLSATFQSPSFRPRLLTMGEWPPREIRKRTQLPRIRGKLRRKVKMHKFKVHCLVSTYTSQGTFKVIGLYLRA